MNQCDLEDKRCKFFVEAIYQHYKFLLPKITDADNSLSFHGRTWNFNKTNIWFSYISSKNKILYIKYINGKRKQSHRKKGHRIKSHKTSRKKSHKKKSHRKKSHQVMVFIATFKLFSVIWWLSVLSFHKIRSGIFSDMFS